MSYQVVVRPEVDADLVEAEAWYEQQQAGLGREFLLAVRETISPVPQPSHLPNSFGSQAASLGIPAPVSLPHHLPRR